MTRIVQALAVVVLGCLAIKVLADVVDTVLPLVCVALAAVGAATFIAGRRR